MESVFIRFFNNFIKGLEFFKLYYSSYPAYVYSTDDPDNLNRLQLIVPHVTGVEVMTNWIYPKNNFAGKGYGVQVLPRKGDTVFVEFEFGNTKKPRWVHGYFIKGEKPIAGNLTSKKNYWFKTPQGNLVEFDDDKHLVRITDEWGNYYESNKTGISLVRAENSILSLGTLDKSAQPAVLGDTNESRLNDILGELESLNNAILKMTTAQVAIASSVYLFSPLVAGWETLQTSCIQIGVKITEIKSVIYETKSTKTTVD